MDDLAAEIEYIQVKGVSATPRQCQKCTRGVADSDQNRCVVCPANEYLAEPIVEYGERTCEPCPADKYSPSNSYGADSCLPRKPCTTEDMTRSYVGDAEEERAGLISECNKDGKRTQTYTWKRPMICDKTTGVALPADKVVPCRGCTRGQHRHPETDKCVFCDEGEYQADDNHDGKGYKIKDCKKCGPGHYAPKKLEFSFFEEMPVQFHASCSEANDLGKAQNCDLM